MALAVKIYEISPGYIFFEVATLIDTGSSIHGKY
jgi:hypothetical protein